MLKENEQTYTKITELINQAIDLVKVDGKYDHTDVQYLLDFAAKTYKKHVKEVIEENGSYDPEEVKYLLDYI